ncbi:MAG: YifB family Mg chelatase-like AAA ATPase [Treponema sp.]|nr:YifB family Mg chelatase-like AAA ATPase [Treponema sp.]
MAYTPYGAAGVIIRVEADIRRGIPGIDISGLADGAVREARERVRAAFRNSGFDFPADRVLINLAPAGFRKYGAALDLPIALSVMAASGLIPLLGDIMVMGELELSGTIRPVRGVLAAIAAGLDAGITEFIVPKENSREAAILGTGHKGPAGQTSRPAACSGALRFAAVANLKEAVDALFMRAHRGFLAGPDLANAAEAGPPHQMQQYPAGDFADVKGQAVYKRALEIAAAGGHNALVFGPPGAGKTMLARRLPSIMAPLTADEAVEVTRLYSLAGPFKAGLSAQAQDCADYADLPSRSAITDDGAFIDGLITSPPFRTPHHSASAEGILGGGKIPRPGEISLAHFGVLFLDEAPEFRANVLQALREPLEDRVISIARAEGVLRLPADFQLLLAANPCPCGRLGIRNAGYADETGIDYNRATDGFLGFADNAEQMTSHCCMCSTNDIYRYWRRIGGALLDRIEIRVAVYPSSIRDLAKAQKTAPGIPSGDSSSEIAGRVAAAVEIQRRRYRGTGIRRNAAIPAGKINRICPMTAQAEIALEKALALPGLSGRALHGILRVSRTIADLAGKDIIEAEHILEAAYHRRQGEDPFEILNPPR